jgi:hypothetical protein
MSGNQLADETASKLHRGNMQIVSGETTSTVAEVAASTAEAKTGNGAFRERYQALRKARVSQ